MLNQKSFVFNLFSENTYILYLETGEAAIIDPGCNDSAENRKLADFISSNGLKPVLLLNTHAHIDHIFGNHFVYEKYGLKPYLHHADLQILEALEYSASFYGTTATASPMPEVFLNDGDFINLGDEKLEVIYAPGHSPGSVCFYSEKHKKLWGGDVLFRESIGRTDLPGGDFDTLAHYIHTCLFTLPDDVIIYSGHGPTTTIGHEKKHNPFVGEAAERM
jgi:glyoxylase-like metal-dependent hydrolase (beta-lactamase superfamily II)